jgi:hypothetical protein
MWFEGYAEFEAVVERMTGDLALHETMRRNGARYVETNYRWPVILDRYCGFVEEFAGRSTKGVP